MLCWFSCVQVGGGLYVSQGKTTLKHSQVRSNTAQREGGGLYGAVGTVELGNGTAFFNNSATTGLGANLHLPGSTVYYVFPVPAGHWLPNGECRVYREPCVRRYGDFYDTVATRSVDKQYSVIVHLSDVSIAPKITVWVHS